MIKNYFRPLLLFALLVSGFSLIYYLWYFQIIYNSIDKNPLLNLLSDKVYLFSLANIVLETLAVSLILLGITIIQKFELRFLSIIYVVILAEYTFLFQALTEFAWLYYNKQTTDLNSLSLYSILDKSDIAGYFHFGLKTINLWELLYVTILTYGIKIFLNKSFFSVLKIVLPVYVFALLMWIVMVTFIEIMNA